MQIQHTVIVDRVICLQRAVERHVGIHRHQSLRRSCGIHSASVFIEPQNLVLDTKHLHTQPSPRQHDCKTVMNNYNLHPIPTLPDPLSNVPLDESIEELDVQLYQIVAEKNREHKVSDDDRLDLVRFCTKGRHSDHRDNLATVPEEVVNARVSVHGHLRVQEEDTDRDVLCLQINPLVLLKPLQPPDCVWKTAILHVEDYTERVGVELFQASIPFDAGRLAQGRTFALAYDKPPRLVIIRYAPFK
mmetsp:Transcript_129018/g.241342  ORF Transcript_129018/g.241342 Transcript_129018/m.241342 type:complete len:245 (+) Transcript_129018:1329-2063(+)